MGRTLPSITQTFLQEQQSLARFRRALRLDDQRALDDLLAASRHHLAEAAYASHLLPFEIMLLAMLVEEHKQVLRLREELETLRGPSAGSPRPASGGQAGHGPSTSSPRPASGGQAGRSQEHSKS